MLSRYLACRLEVTHQKVDLRWIFVIINVLMLHILALGGMFNYIIVYLLRTWYCLFIKHYQIDQRGNIQKLLDILNGGTNSKFIYLRNTFSFRVSIKLLTLILFRGGCTCQFVGSRNALNFSIEHKIVTHSP